MLMGLKPEFRSLLEKNHADSDGFWLRISKKKSGRAEDDFGNVAARRKISSVANGRNSREDGEKTNPVMKAIPQMKKLDTNKLKQVSLR